MVYLKDEATGVTVEDAAKPKEPLDIVVRLLPFCAQGEPTVHREHFFESSEADALLRGLLRWKLERGHIEAEALCWKVMREFYATKEPR